MNGLILVIGICEQLFSFMVIGEKNIFKMVNGDTKYQRVIVAI